MSQLKWKACRMQQKSRLMLIEKRDPVVPFQTTNSAMTGT